MPCLPMIRVATWMRPLLYLPSPLEWWWWMRYCGGGGYGISKAAGLHRGGMWWWVLSPSLLPFYIGGGGRFREPTEPRAEYADRAFTNNVPFNETGPTEPVTAVRYWRVCLYRWSPKLRDVFVFWTPFLHTNSDLGVLRLVELIWTRAKTSQP
jgi:hypothetical protein